MRTPPSACRPSRRLAASVILLVLAPTVVADAVNPAKALANRVIDMYSLLETYRDAGTVVVTVTSAGREPARSTSRFTTRFARPDRLRFDIARVGDAMGEQAVSVWHSAEGAFVRIGDGAALPKKDIEAAMLSAGGDSSSVLYLVPRYLFLSEKCCGYRNLPGARLLGSESDGARTLEVLEFDYSERLKRRLWVDPHSLLIHRVETSSEQGGHRVRTVVTFLDIAVNEPLDDALFRVAAPAGIGFDVARLDAQGLRGVADGKVAVAYEFCIPAHEAEHEAVVATDASVRCTRGSRGRIGCARDELLCIGSTHQPGWRRVLEALAALPFVGRIEEAFFE